MRALRLDTLALVRLNTLTQVPTLVGNYANQREGVHREEAKRRHWCR
jgi:hypothetical protein